jgi:hypothetical protein
MTRVARVLIIFLISFSICGVVYAERKNYYGAGIDFMGGMSNRIGTSGSVISDEFNPFYGAYPSVSLSSVGRHSILDLDYTFAVDRYEMTEPLTITSHTFSAGFNAQLSARTHLRLSDSFNNAPDYSTINVLKGFNLTNEGFEYIFEPELYKRSSISNSAGAEFEVDLSARSSLTFSGSGSFRYYDDSVNRSYLSNQFRIAGGLAYSRRSSEHHTWKLQYNVRQNEYRDYDPARTHSATFGFEHRLTPNTDLTIAAGPSFTERRGNQKAYFGYDVSARISWRVNVNVFSAGYAHRPGDSTGLGTASDSHQGNLAFSRIFGQKTSLRLQASAFRQSGRSTDLYDYWGVRGSMALSRQFGKHWFLTAGASYTDHERQALSYSDNDYRRFYVSIGYRIQKNKNATNYTN